MREIKFRAWDTKTDNWVEGIELVIHTTGRLLRIPDHVILMQFTGLVDKTGHEIYEGDIVHVNAGTLETRNVYGCVVWDTVTVGWRVKVKETAHVPSSSMIVVSTIYEHPELLNL